jgi:hemerythrin-like domain-containing protein
MQPTQVLMDEHRVIEQVIGCVEKMAEQAANEGALNTEHAFQAVEFIRHFADHCHHAKEEDQLFRLMYDRGFSPEQGPLAVMLDEHEQGRRHVRAMDEAIAAYSHGDDAALEQFAFHARSYAELLRGHIVKEDFILYPMADEAFSDDDQESLREAFAAVEAKHTGAHAHDRFLGIAATLGEAYGVTRPTGPDRERLSQICPAHAGLGRSSR